MSNEKEKLINALETLNSEYLELKKSKEYLLGKRILDNINTFKNYRVKGLILRLKKKINAKKYIKFCEKYNVNYDSKELEYNIDSKFTPKVAVYTCIVGNYDIIKDPIYKNENFDYYIFTDQDTVESKIWNKIDIPKEILGMSNNTLINRYIKFHPKHFFSEYDYAIYIDGNIRIVSDISSIVSKANVLSGIAMHKHYKRNCIFMEGEACILLGKGSKNELYNQLKSYSLKGFPKEFGLFEANMIISDIKNINSEKIMNDWWNEFIAQKSFRDQIVFPYIIWKNNMSIKDVGILGNNIYENIKLQVENHK